MHEKKQWESSSFLALLICCIFFLERDSLRHIQILFLWFLVRCIQLQKFRKRDRTKNLSIIDYHLVSSKQLLAQIPITARQYLLLISTYWSYHNTIIPRRIRRKTYAMLMEQQSPVLEAKYWISKILQSKL